MTFAPGSGRISFPNTESTTGESMSSATFAEISAKTGLSTRRLCYILEHDFFGISEDDTPPWDKQSGHGNTRSFTEFEAFGICVVAMMLDAGLRRREIKKCMARLNATTSDTKRNLLLLTSTSKGGAVLEIGDRQYYRFTSDGALPMQKVDTGWRRIDSGDSWEGRYEPFVRIAIHVSRIREALKS